MLGLAVFGADNGHRFQIRLGIVEPTRLHNRLQGRDRPVGHNLPVKAFVAGRNPFEAEALIASRQTAEGATLPPLPLTA